MRQHTHQGSVMFLALASRRMLHTSAYVSIRQHPSASVSIRQHTSAYVSIRQNSSAYVSIRKGGMKLLAHEPPRAAQRQYLYFCTSKASKLTL
jgi:hypothetical protein